MNLNGLFPAAFVASLLLAPAQPEKPQAFEFRDGDRVVLLGGTLIEREQRYGYWETALTSRFPDKNITFRNLAWSGDTVWGEARAGFDPPQKGYERLVEMTKAMKPTVILIAYGTNEAFAGRGYGEVDRFERQLRNLLDLLEPTKARIILLAPPMFEKSTWKAPDLEQRQRDLEYYTEAIFRVALNARFVKEFCQRYGPGFPLTDDGMHLTPYGYSRTANQLLNELMITPPAQKIVAFDGLSSKTIQQDVLTNPPVPKDGVNRDAQADSMVLARDLKAGKYTLSIDGRPAHTANAQKWMREPIGELVLHGPSLDQAEKLRQTIVEKNRLFFNRWRPQNETYLFGFRKHEQGQNAKEIPEFDPLIEKLEKEIAKLKKPVPHTYQLVPVKEEQK